MFKCLASVRLEHENLGQGTGPKKRAKEGPLTWIEKHRIKIPRV